MLYWLLLLICAYASSVFGAAVFSVGQKWQIVLLNPPIITATSKVIPLDAPVWDIDAFDADADTVRELHAQGRIVICYFSAGTYEPWRPDAAEFQAGDKGASLAPQWPDENWLNVKSDNVKKIMSARIKMAASLGCDAVDPDNVDGYDNTNGLGLSAADAVTYVRWLATTAATYKMQIGLKNAQGILPQVMDVMSFCVNEQCVQYGQCDLYSEFLASGKPVFHIEYPASAPNSVSPFERNMDCNPPGVTGMSTVMKNITLGGWVAYCDGTYETTLLDDGGNGGNSGNGYRPPPGPKSTTRRTSTTMRTSTRSTSMSRITFTYQRSTFRPPTPTARPPTTNPRAPATKSRSTSTTRSSSATSSSTTEAPRTTSTTEAPSRTSRSEGPSRTSSSGTSSSSGNRCKSKHYDQCGGTNWKGCTECEDGFTCKGISAPYYYQCV